MLIALTHEQADFDALASLLGTHLLDESVLPVLPRRSNRNVRAFLTIYGANLPFVDPRDLTGGPIEAITLVDTQSVVSVKGMSEATRMRVIDHHPLRDDLPLDWDITVSGTGANTTLFVENIQERDLPLSTIEATLLLLGIYEDTGSLTYYRTTPRDLRAASYLLEQGASLQIAADYLNHPLSEGQQALYDRLRSSAEIFNVHGFTVVITSAEGRGMEEEISTVAHKLRDLLDPDALFVLVDTKGGVQLVARSTSSNIDVAEIAEEFGGGGHERAAAGLIKDRISAEIIDQLKQILPRRVLPAVTVAQIMSSSPHLISPDTLVDDVAIRMQRYGYEGYPVVEDGRVIGLLTRRAVDRALAHNLHYPARKLMDAGEHTVKPDDSIDYLQHIMTETGWGQIPVVDTESGEIIGIVTRTDLIKSLTQQTRLTGRQNLSKRLQAALPAVRSTLLMAVSQVAYAQRLPLYLVGGFVRDLLLNSPSQDFDLVVEGDAIALAQALAEQYSGRVTSHTRFGTAKWHIHKLDMIKRLSASLSRSETSSYQPSDLPDSLDFVSARTEFYTFPTALPTVERGSIKLDLHRRDFTINTLALRLDGHHYGELHDYWGGLSDLRHGVVRVLHSLSFIDDPTRILRAVRFEQRFAFEIEKRTSDLLTEAKPLLGKVSGDRLRHELDHILSEQTVVRMLSRLQELDLLAVIHPALVWDVWLANKYGLALCNPPGMDWGIQPTGTVQSVRELLYILWLIRLQPDQAASVIVRLKFSAMLGKMILLASQLFQDLPELKAAQPSHLSEMLADIPPLSIYAVNIAADDETVKGQLHAYITTLQWIKPTINGNDLRARGLPPGPQYRQILDDLKKAWLDGKVNSRELEIELLEKLIANLNHGLSDT
jgi:tRNA nucleotidyltransferase (CCA-adding enzyme)